MTNLISECIGDIISIADGNGDDAWKLENANACADVLLSSRPQVADDFKDRLTIEANRNATLRLQIICWPKCART